MLIYIINIFSLFFWKLLYEKMDCEKKKKKKIIIIAITLQFTLIQGLRSFNVGSDTFKYISYYELICDGDFSFLALLTKPPLNFEVGYLWLMKILAIFNFSSRMFLIAISLIINILISYFIYKESEDFIMSYWIFIGIEYFTLSFTMFRQMIAIGLVLLSFCFFKKNEKVSFLISILAYFFHKTSIVFLICLIIYKIIILLETYKKEYISFRNIILIEILIYIVLIIFSKKILTLITTVIYSYYQLENSQLGTLWFVMIAILVLLLYVYRKKEKLNLKNQSELYFFIIVMFLASFFQYLSIYLPLTSRVALYFYIFTIIILPYLSNVITTKKIRKYFKFAIYILTFFQYIIFSMNLYNLIPYTIF